MKRRQFVFWFGFGLFALGEKLRVGGLDSLAAATMRFGEVESEATPAAKPEHWTAAENNSWRWFERETLIDARWKLTGMTSPINKLSGERYTGRTGYLEDRLVPEKVRRGEQVAGPRRDKEGVGPGPHLADASRRARHGRPPSKWLRSLRTPEIRVWLKTIDVPEAGVNGMTYWTHLTRDHSFDPDHIAGLEIDEQAKLHAAAHYGY